MWIHTAGPTPRFGTGPQDYCYLPRNVRAAGEVGAVALEDFDNLLVHRVPDARGAVPRARREQVVWSVTKACYGGGVPLQHTHAGPRPCNAVRADKDHVYKRRVGVLLAPVRHTRARAKTGTRVRRQQRQQRCTAHSRVYTRAQRSEEPRLGGGGNGHVLEGGGCGARAGVCVCVSHLSSTRALFCLRNTRRTGSRLGCTGLARPSWCGRQSP